VVIRIYSVAGREVANISHQGAEGPNNVVWDGSLSNGAKATPGVYFYRIDGADFSGSKTAQKMILLSSN
jgi:flagellar hook assembly protein FlgD